LMQAGPPKAVNSAAESSLEGEQKALGRRLRGKFPDEVNPVAYFTDTFNRFSEASEPPVL